MSVTDISTETDMLTLLGILSGLTSAVRDFTLKFPTPDGRQRTLLWDDLTFMQMVLARIELLMLKLDVAEAKEKQEQKVQYRRVVQP